MLRNILQSRRAIDRGRYWKVRSMVSLCSANLQWGTWGDRSPSKLYGQDHALREAGSCRFYNRGAKFPVLRVLHASCSVTSISLGG